MPWSSGIYTRGYPSWTGDANNNLPISATKFDLEDNDFAAGLNNCMTIDGLNRPAATMNWNGHRLTNLGIASDPTDALSQQSADTRYLLQTVVVPVQKYGGLDDNGVSDNTTAINNAITALSALGGGTLFFPVLSTGVYGHIGTITLAGNVTLLGYGATLKYSGSGTQLQTPSTGVVIKSGIIGLNLTGLSATVQMQLNSIYQCTFKDIVLITNSTTNTCIIIAVNTSGTTNSGGNYNSAFNLFENILQDRPAGGNGCGTFLALTGTDASHVTTLNTFVNCNASLINVVGIDFQQWCDSNTFNGSCEIFVNGAISPANGIGVALSRTGNGVYAENFQMLTVDTFGSPGTDNRQGIVANYTNIVKFVNVGLFEFGPSVTANALNITSLTSGIINQAPRGVTNYLSYDLVGANVGIGAVAAANCGCYATVGAQLSGSSQYNYFANGTVYNQGSPSLGASFGCQPGGASSSSPYTVTSSMGFYCATGSNGTNATITNSYGFRCDDQAYGGTNFGFYSNMAAASNKWAFFGAGTAASLLTGPLTVSAIAVPSGGTAGQGLMFSTATNLGIFFGVGAPGLAAAQGSIYLRTDGSSTSTRLYVNTNGSTGWTNFTSAS